LQGSARTSERASRVGMTTNTARRWLQVLAATSAARNPASPCLARRATTRIPKVTAGAESQMLAASRRRANDEFHNGEVRYETTKVGTIKMRRTTCLEGFL